VRTVVDDYVKAKRTQRKFTHSLSSDEIVVTSLAYAGDRRWMSTVMVASHFMRNHVVKMLIVASALLAASAAASRGRVTVSVADDRVEVRIDDDFFTSLQTAKGRNLVLDPIQTASGKRVTRSFQTEQVRGASTDHPRQRGAWIGAAWVNDADFWDNEPSENNPRAGSVVLTDVSDVQSGGERGRFTIHADWIAPNGEKLITETRTTGFSGPSPEQRIVDIDLRLAAVTEVTFADNHNALLGLRLRAEFEEARGGKVVNAEGSRGWERLRGSRSAWVDWHGNVDGEDVGVAVMDAPTNYRFPTPWYLESYALLTASPFMSRNYQESAPDASVSLKAGDELRLRYRILVHSAATDIRTAFQSFSK
jgi:hypothetical protein